MSIEVHHPLYGEYLQKWKKCRAVCSGEDHVKKLDTIVSVNNLLLPFSYKMGETQYAWYKAEAELPGLVSQYVKIIQGGLLRKQPYLEFHDQSLEGRHPASSPHVLGRIGPKHLPLISFLAEVLQEELMTSRAVIHVDYSTHQNISYPRLFKPEQVINWQCYEDGSLRRVVICYETYDYIGSEDPYMPNLKVVHQDHHMRWSEDHGREVYMVHEVVSGKIDRLGSTHTTNDNLTGLKVPLKQGEPLSEIPIWFLNGSVDPVEPMLAPLVSKEVALYNKLSRRNHLLFGACTYTPVLHSSSIDDSEFIKIIERGLGSWIKIDADDRIDVLQTPTAALADMSEAIRQNVDEMTRMGLRILSPDPASGTSGIALEIRNSPQTAQLGLLNNKLSASLKEVFEFMLSWTSEHYRSPDYEPLLNYPTESGVHLDFRMSADFNASPLGVEWARLVTEWYQDRIIPRSEFVRIVKQQDVLSSDYDDQQAREELRSDPEPAGPDFGPEEAGAEFRRDYEESLQPEYEYEYIEDEGVPAEDIEEEEPLPDEEV